MCYYRENHTEGIGKMKVAVIGTGVAGVSVLRELAKQKSAVSTLDVLVFGDTQTFGTGLPYQADDDGLLLNQTPETMSIMPDDPEHFVRWLQRHTEWADPYGKNVPRNLYGRYLRAVMKDLLDELKAEVHEEKVDNIHVENSNQFAVVYGKERRVVDAVHLCIGHLPYSDPYHLKGEENYVHHPYPVHKKLARIPDGASVGIIGTGLTAIDLLLYLQKEKENVRIHLTSLDNSFGSIRGEEQPVPLVYFSKERIFKEREKHNGFIPLEVLVEWFKKESALHRVSAEEMWKTYGEGTIDGMKRDLSRLDDIGRFQSVIHQLDDVLPELWESLSAEDKETFFKRYGRKWEKFRSPIPKQTALKLLELHEKGQFQLAGRTKRIVKEPDFFRIELEEGTALEVNYIINATGQKKQVAPEDEEMPLVAQMLEEGLLQKEPFGGVQVTWPSLSAVSPQYGLLPRFKVYGQLASGVQFGNNTVGMISWSAREAVKSSLS